MYRVDTKKPIAPAVGFFCKIYYCWAKVSDKNPNRHINPNSAYIWIGFL